MRITHLIVPDGARSSRSSVRERIALAGRKRARDDLRIRSVAKGSSEDGPPGVSPKSPDAYRDLEADVGTPRQLTPPLVVHGAGRTSQAAPVWRAQPGSRAVAYAAVWVAPFGSGFTARVASRVRRYIAVVDDACVFRRRAHSATATGERDGNGRGPNPPAADARHLHRRSRRHADAPRPQPAAFVSSESYAWIVGNHETARDSGYLTEGDAQSPGDAGTDRNGGGSSAG